MNKKWAVWLVAIIMMISVGTLLIVPTMTKNQGVSWQWRWII